ncbi:PAS domain S-box protein [Fulvivirga maritima]|uniref:PAS domain S-box protein n=1 Tax=Fulvivirga maritima TaxID=2904247 RepID=UPI001F174FF5|nr:PAS domain S-box protein [Fulvivirga maritima]UII24734.1 PAS domain S-box protein [Fulvivirga maritima]
MQFVRYAPVSIAMFDRHMNYIACSHKWLTDWWVKSTPIHIDDLIGQNHYEVFPDVIPYWKSVHKRALKGAMEFNENDEFIKENGQKEILRWDARPWRDDQNKIGGIIVHTEFITERKKNEELLKKSRARLSKLVENIPGVPYSCNHDSNRTILFVSNAVEDLTGYHKEDFIKKASISFVKLIVPEDKDRVWKTREEYINKKEAFEIHYRIRTRYGEIKYIFERGQGVFSERDELISIEGILLDVTKQKLLEEELKQSQAVLLKAQKLANLGNWEMDLETGDVYWSEQLFKILGLEDNEVVPTFEKGLDYLHPDDHHKAKEGIRKTLSGSNDLSLEYRILRKDGSIRNVIIRNEKDEQAKKLIGTIQDITDRKKGDQALKESEERNKSLIKALPDCMFIHNINGTILDFELPKNSPFSIDKSIIGKKLDSLYPPSVANELLEVFKKAYEENELQTHEFELPTSKGLLYCEARVITRNSDQILCIVRDITKAKREEYKALQSLKSFYSAFYISPVPVTISQLADGTLIDVNSRFCELVKLKKEDVIGKTTTELNFWPDLAARNRFIEKISVEGKVYEYEEEIRISDGSIIDVLISAEVISIEEKSCLLLMLSDISERKKNEKELLKLTEKLTTSNQELKQFAYITSHNLRAPIVNIDTLISFINKEDTGATGNAEIIDRIGKSFTQLKSSLNDLIQLVTLRDQKYEANEEVSFNKVFHIVYDSIETQIKSTNVEIETAFNVQTVMFKRALMESILLNLLSNAIKYRNMDAPHITIKTGSTHEGKVFLSVKDNGLGMDLAKNKDRLFGMYQRFHENTEGKGLGLYIIKSQVESMGGNIEVESALGKGSTFTVFFNSATASENESSS